MARLSRRAIATYVADQLLSDADRTQLMMQLAAYLVDNHRTKELALIIRDIQFYLSEKGSVSGVITTATDLTAETKKAVEKYVKQQTGATDVLLDSVVDPSVIGGVKVSIPGRELDATVSRSLTILKTRFKKA
jgi:F-type H+-transporting ATPase subunit delta